MWTSWEALGALGRVLSSLDKLLGPLEALLEALLEAPDPLSVLFGGSLWGLGASSIPFWALLGRAFVLQAQALFPTTGFGPSWNHLGAILEPSWG